MLAIHQSKKYNSNVQIENLSFKLFFIIFFLFLTLKAQEQPILFFEEQLESILEATPEADAEMIEEVLKYKIEKKIIFINSANKDEWRSLDILTEEQIEKILNYRKKYGNFLSIFELQAVGLPLEVLKQLRLYCRLEDNSLDSWKLKNFKKGKQELHFRYTRVLEPQEGYRKIDKNGNEKPIEKRYLGSPDAVYFRYRYQWPQHLSMGFSLSKSPGELVFKNPYYNKGFDFYSAHVMVQNLFFVKTLLIGDYQALFGQGLNFYSTFGTGKNTQVLQIDKAKEGFFPHTSFNEYQFLRGVAVDFQLPKNFSWAVFTSFRKKDANILTSEDEEEEILGTIYTTNEHNTISSIERKNQLAEWLIGSHLYYKTRTLKWGFTSYYLQLDYPIEVSDKLYKKYDFSGREHFNVGTDFRWTLKNFYLFGEIGFTKNASFAFLLGSILALHPQLSVVAVVRNYQKDYHSFYAQAFGEGTKAQNQQGIYLGFVWDFLTKLQVQSYWDVYKIPWLTSKNPAESIGLDYFVQLNYTYKKRQLMYFKYRYRQKEITETIENAKVFKTNPAHEWRWNVDYNLGKDWQGQNRVEVRYQPNLVEEKTWGYAFFQDFTWKKKSFPFSVSVRYVLFYTSFDTRVYAYEKDIPSAYPITYYYDKGHRFYIYGQYKLKKYLDVWLRYDLTYYTDKNLISSGYKEIRGQIQSEVKLALRYRI